MRLLNKQVVTRKSTTRNKVYRYLFCPLVQNLFRIDITVYNIAPSTDKKGI